MSYLFILSLGPVQEFIATARRTRDLWFGSWLLSDLSKAAARAVLESSRGDEQLLIFPAPRDLEHLSRQSEFTVANKVVAVVESVETVTRRTVEEIQKRLLEVADQAFSDLLKTIPKPFHFDENRARAQLRDVLEVHWAAVRIREVKDYANARRLAETLLAARKSTRDFGPVLWASSSPKSSLDGQRETVFPKNLFTKHESASSARGAYRIREAEQLCGVGLLKRHGRRRSNDSFFSTSHVAALPFLDGLSEQHAELARKYVSELRKLKADPDALSPVAGPGHPRFGPYDGHLLYEERLADFFDPQDKTTLSRARQQLTDFFDQTERRPSPYYGLLLGDGDGIGTLITRERTIEGHRMISQLLADFSIQVRTLVRSHRGSLVYSGGDDVLAFLPLHTIRRCAREVRDLFVGTLESAGLTSTFSAGVAVCHHLDPLEDALELVRQTERFAKEVAGKDALAISISKRSGPPLEVRGSWLALDERLTTWVRFHRLDLFPDSAAFELRDLARRLSVPPAYPDHVVLQKATRLEALRILSRKRSQHGAEEISDEVLDLLESLLQGDSRGSLETAQLAEEIIAARIFAESEDLAQVPLQPEEG